MILRLDNQDGQEGFGVGGLKQGDPCINPCGRRCVIEHDKIAEGTQGECPVVQGCGFLFCEPLRPLAEFMRDTLLRTVPGTDAKADHR
ncbi:hypothetical protein BJI67_08085 [Acidihalobacter aeolianus]|uniref:Uncharacterized protein n=1 Tax=Acidihalobacter aeolianus TaxID=2792603 RepID=A0A1D8K7S1_9GAMM|nr:hypothetical protein BJI67_08085 [Acidihalobacter aeolianus]